MKMNWKKGLVATFCFGLFSVIVFFYMCGDGYCGENEGVNANMSPQPLLNDALSEYRNGRLSYNSFSDTDLPKSQQVNIYKDDVIVFLHIQKTGGTTFGRHLVKDLKLKYPCKCYKNRKRCDCYTKKKTIWLFSRYSTGWVCGLHADWTELTSCVDGAMDKKEKSLRDRKYHYITILRDPVKRYLSEWKHVQRGATWKATRLFCDGRSATKDEVTPCYNTSDWRGVTLDEFLNCKDNLAKNRQTRMLANLSLVHCYNTSGMTPEKRDQIMLDSAKENLLKMAYFGLTEFQVYTQRLFEYSFDLKFVDDFSQLPVTHSDRSVINERQKEEILNQNKLDIALYQYAKDLFLQRVQKMKAVTDDDEMFILDYNDYKDRFDDSVDINEDDDEEDEDDSF